MKHPKDYSVDEVCVFFVSLELGHLVSKIRDNSVDGGLLVSLSESDFVNDLGLSGLQTKRVLRGIDFASELAGGGGEGKGRASDEEVAALKEKVGVLERENKELKEEVMNLRAALQPEPPKPKPQPQQQYSQPPPQEHHHHRPPGAPVVREAAKGTARGAVLGAVAGAVAGDPAKGAAMGAAVGATAGGMRGLGERRRERMIGRF